MITRKAVRNQVWKKTRGKCWYCGCDIDPFGKEPCSFSVDHTIPKTKGGSDHIENLVPSCRTCNTKKSNRTIEEFRNLYAVKFTEKQKDYLLSKGFDQFVGIPHVFYFESTGL